MKKLAIYNLVFLLMFATGCSDYLEFPQEGELPVSGLDYSKKENMFAPVSNAYASMRQGNAHGFAYLGMLEITSDDADKGSTETDGATMIELNTFKYTASTDHINLYWTDVFNVVSAANNAIYTLPKFTEILKTDADVRNYNGMMGESRFIRGYAYFCLVRAYGGVPIIDQLKTSEELASTPRADKDSVYAFIHRDLTYAVQNMPESYSKDWAGRVTKYSAMAMKAKVFLYQEKWDSVAFYTNQVIASGRFDLYNNFYKMFRIDAENCEESLFEIQNSSLGLQDGDRKIASEYGYIQGPRNNSPENMQGWGFKVPSNALISFLNGRGETERIKATIMVRGTMTPEGDSIASTCVNPYYNMKTYTPSSYNKWAFNGYGMDQNIRILRYAEVLLMHAEALANGASVPVTMTADEAMNKVRNRVLLSTPGGYSLNDIYDERRAELALEENRFYDLVRTNRAQTVLGSAGYTGKNALFPVPQRQRDLNPSLTQNPGY